MEEFIFMQHIYPSVHFPPPNPVQGYVGAEANLS